MMRSIFLLIVMPAVLLANSQNPLPIPPLLQTDTFFLDVGEHVYQFYPGVNTSTYGVNGPYLGPTLLLQKGDTARMRVKNELSQVTNMHWHGMHVRGEMDGGPQREVIPGEYWDVKYKVENPAGTYWYHPHTHMLTGTQATKGIAGMIIVRDDEEAALELPRTYGVDDIPIVIQDRRWLPGGNFSTGPYGDSVLVNGTPDAFLELPAQVVRLRMLNGSNARVYALGFENDELFHVIAGDGGLLHEPIGKQRQWLSNGERVELLLDLSGMEGDSLLLMSYGSELPSSVPGGNNPIWESSILNGIDFPVLRIRIIAPTADPVITIPATLGTSQAPQLAESIQDRFKVLSGTGMVGMGMFSIDGLMFDMEVINDIVLLGSVETWTIMNASNMAHPMHIHGVSFYVLERDFAAPPPEERGAKDVVLIDQGETVKLIMRFDHGTDGWPFMYHCHNLMHEDNMMMLQFTVQDINTATPDRNEAAELLIYPMPANTQVNWHASFPVETIVLIDMLGKRILQTSGNARELGTIDISTLPAGRYMIEMRGADRRSIGTVVKD